MLVCRSLSCGRELTLQGLSRATMSNAYTITRTSRWPITPMVSRLHPSTHCHLGPVIGYTSVATLHPSVRAPCQMLCLRHFTSSCGACLWRCR